MKKKKYNDIGFFFTNCIKTEWSEFTIGQDNIGFPRLET